MLMVDLLPHLNNHKYNNNNDAGDIDHNNGNQGENNWDSFAVI